MSANAPREDEAARSATRSAPRREGAWFVGLVALSRLALLAVLARLVHGQEFTDDVQMLMGMARAPFELLAGITTHNGQHPPLLGVLEAIVAWPLQRVLPDFYAARLTFIAWETLTAAFFWAALSATVPEARVRRRLEAAFLLLPMGWMTSVVMSQDEVIAACFIAAVLWLAATHRSTAALVVCGVGVVAAKIFLAVPLLALVVALPEGRLWKRAAAGFAPVVAVYAWVSIAARIRGDAAPLADFAPEAAFGVNVWVWLSERYHITAEGARRWSGLMGLVGGLAPVALLRLRGEPADPRRLAALFSAMLLWVFALFYHVNPEYYVMGSPAVLLAFSGWLELAPVALLLSVPWAVNFFFGVRNAMAAGSSGGKGVFVRIYQTVFPVSPAVMFQVSLWLCIAVTLWMAVASTRAAVRTDGASR
jgi:hypothetical protein